MVPDDVKKKPPKFIERVIEKMEETLTAPAPQSKPASQGKKEDKPIPQPQQSSQMPSQMEGSLGGESEAILLPKGTTITFPDGKAFETQTQSRVIPMREDEATG